MRQLIVVLLLLPFLLAPSCNSFEKQAYVSLKASQATYNQLTDEISKAYIEGRITEAEYDQAVELFRKWGQAHNAAKDALASYHLQKTQANEDAFLLALLQANLWLQKAEQLSGKGKP